MQPQRELYSAGRCILAPFGDWAKAADKQFNSISNLTPVIDIAEVYFTNIPPMYRIKSNVIVNVQNTKLYKNEDMNPDDIITTLKKGTKAIIVGSKRIFSMDEFTDIYKIRFTIPYFRKKVKDHDHTVKYPRHDCCATRPK